MDRRFGLGEGEGCVIGPSGDELSLRRQQIASLHERIEMEHSERMAACQTYEQEATSLLETLRSLRPEATPEDVNARLGALPENLVGELEARMTASPDRMPKVSEGMAIIKQVGLHNEDAGRAFDVLAMQFAMLAADMRSMAAGSRLLHELHLRRVI